MADQLANKSRLQDQTRNLKVDVNIDTTVTGHNLQKTVMSTEIVTTISNSTVKRNAKNKIFDSVTCVSESMEEGENKSTLAPLPIKVENRPKDEIDSNMTLDNLEYHDNSTTKSLEIKSDQPLNKKAPHEEIDVNESFKYI